ncbi:hypothetical protein K488DRAFT_90409 [Vararia minispora EC-137]|uniref:Uncharacterized protein n=1 Tax=Vararia minispora EC-137 TaxID=1314806 RepID=A0ACB8Q7Z5_9AGAM|nr:hypothetical protein K488DRAFT_90409 [Vararia minispora EC-137]
MSTQHNPSALGQEAQWGELGASAQNQYSDPLDRFWNLYITDVEKSDKVLTESWKGDTDGILIFTGLFATTVASFLIFSLPSLSPDPAQQSADILQQITFQLAQISQQLASPPLASLESFGVLLPAVRINILYS